MIKVAIVDDEEKERERLRDFFSKIEKACRDRIETQLFSSGEQLGFFGFKGFDLICLDIDMKGVDGIETARQIRKADTDVVIIFVTNMAQMAIAGYEVHAFDFILKPVNYYDFAMKIQNALSLLKGRRQKNIFISTPEGPVKISTDELCYVEVDRHYLYFHTLTETHRQKSSMKETEESLKGYSFSRCNNCYLVNLKYVDRVKGDDVIVRGNYLKISRPRKKEFLESLANYMGGVGI